MLCAGCAFSVYFVAWYFQALVVGKSVAVNEDNVRVILSVCVR